MAQITYDVTLRGVVRLFWLIPIPIKKTYRDVRGHDFPQNYPPGWMILTTIDTRHYIINMNKWKRIDLSKEFELVQEQARAQGQQQGGPPGDSADPNGPPEEDPERDL